MKYTRLRPRSRTMKRKYVRRYRKSIPRSIRPKNVLSVTRKFFTGAWAFSTATTADFWKYYTYTLGDLPSYTEFQGVFDEYRIKAIKVEFRPDNDGVFALRQDVATATTVSNTVSQLHVVVDPASTLVPSGVYNTTAVNSVLENQGVRTHRANRPITVYFRPKLTAGVTGSGTVAVMETNNTWIRTSDAAASYRGFHALWQVNTNSAVNAPTFLVYVTYYMQFKNMR